MCLPLRRLRILDWPLKTISVLIADGVQQTGIIDRTPVYPREAVRGALEPSATAVILVHNHPTLTGSPVHPPYSRAVRILIVCATDSVTCRSY